VRKDASHTEQEQDSEQREASWNGGTTGGAGLGVGAARRATVLRAERDAESALERSRRKRQTEKGRK
jgi:hypothetical protein